MKHLIFTFMILIGASAFSKEVPPLKYPVTDLANILSSSAKESLNNKLYDFKQNQGPQISVLTIKSLDGEDIFEYSQKVFNSWKLGDEKKDDGLLIVISLNDRKSRIHVGDGLEGVVTDAHSIRILDSLRPFLKNAQYDEALESAVDQVLTRITKGYEEEKAYNQNLNSGSQELKDDSKGIKKIEVYGFLIVAAVSVALFFRRTFNDKLSASNKELDKSKKKEQELFQENKFIETESSKFFSDLDENMDSFKNHDVFATMDQMNKVENLSATLTQLQNECTELQSTINRYLRK